MGDLMQEVPPPLPYEESSDGSRTYLEEETPRLLIDTEISMGDEVLREEGHASCQTDRTKKRACASDGD
jgi:hypothetical protein